MIDTQKAKNSSILMYVKHLPSCFVGKASKYEKKPSRER